MRTELTSAVIPSLLLKVNGKDFIVEFPLSALVKAEQKIGRSLKTLQDWFALRTEDIPAILEAGLGKHHPQIIAEDIQAICDRLNPEALDEVQYALCKLAFPRTLAKLEEARVKAAEGKHRPNVQSGAAH